MKVTRYGELFNIEELTAADLQMIYKCLAGSKDQGAQGNAVIVPLIDEMRVKLFESWLEKNPDLAPVVVEEATPAEG